MVPYGVLAYELENQDTLILKTLEWPQGVHNTKVSLCSSQQHDGHSTEMMRLAFSSRSTW